MKPILIFGSRGQVGRALEHAPGVAKGRALHLMDTDITDAEAVKAVIGGRMPAAVINCAVYRDVDKAEAEPERAWAVNVEGVENLARACANEGAALVHLSSDYVFDGQSSQPYAETDQPGPQTVFGQTKLEGEAMAALCANHMILRTQWLYGPYGRNFAKTMLAKAQAGEALRVVSDQVGCPTHTADLANAILLAAEGVVRDPSLAGVYHVNGGGTPLSWADFAREITGLAVTDITTAESGAACARPAYSALNCDKFRQAFSWAPTPRAIRIAETKAARAPA